MESSVRVKCGFADCLSYQAVSDSQTHCICTHPQKTDFLDAASCPLYRLDWQKASKAAEERRVA